MHWIKKLGYVTVVALWLTLIYYPIPGIPPLHKFFLYTSSPLQINSINNSNEVFKSSPFGEISIGVNEIGVPHIFGKNELSVSYALGYMHARDRLFQMEMITRQVSGRLCEVVGEKAYQSDRLWRKFHFEKNAIVWLNNLKKISQADYDRYIAYAEGVNYYIKNMPYGKLPLEFHLLGFKPSKFKPENAYLLVRAMDHRLNYSEDDLKYSETSQMLTDSLMQFYYGFIDPLAYPIYPELSPKMDAVASQLPLAKTKQVWKFKDLINITNGELGQGSNNWAVAATRTTTGGTYLCNDPHLTLNFPSTWYEAQLNFGNTTVHGMSIPGSPFIISGFNTHAAWGMTNATWNLVDFYNFLTPENTPINSKNAYKTNPKIMLDGKTTQLQKITDTLKIKGIGNRLVDYFESPFGPVDTFGGQLLATNWIAMMESHESLTFRGLEKSRSVSESRKALHNFMQPPQNIVLSDDSGHVGMVTAGLGAIHKTPSVGIIVATKLSDKVDYKPLQGIFSIENPVKGWVASANQHQVNSDFSKMVSHRFEPAGRGRRIAQVMESRPKHSIDDMKNLQKDIVDIEWSWLKERMKQYLPPNEFEKLNGFSGVFDTLSTQATLFYAFKLQLIKNASLQIAPDLPWNPSHDIVLNHLLTKATLPTKKGDISVKDLFISSWDSTKNELTKKFGSDSKNWQYGKYHQTHIKHLTGLPALSFEPFASVGNNRTVNVAANLPATTGPSMRSLITFSKDGPQAWFMLTGGQNGKINSKNYSNQIRNFRRNEYHKVLLKKSFKPANYQTSIKFN